MYNVVQHLLRNVVYRVADAVTRCLSAESPAIRHSQLLSQYIVQIVTAGSTIRYDTIEEFNVDSKAEW